MLITIELRPEVEAEMRVRAARGDVEAVRRLLLSAIGPTVDALLRELPPEPLPDEEFERLADELADEFEEDIGPDVPPLSDYAATREGIYEDHP